MATSDGVANLEALTSVGSADGGVPSLALLTALASADGGVPSLQSLTGDASQLGTTGDGAARLLSLTSTGTLDQSNTADGDVTLEKLTAFGAVPDSVRTVLEALTATGLALNGTFAAGIGVLRSVEADSVGSGVNPAVGTAVMQVLTATSTTTQDNRTTADLTLAAVQADGVALNGGVAFGSPRFEALSIAGVGYPLGVSTGAPIMEYVVVDGFSEADIAQTYRTWAINTANEALTEYTNSSFNSYAKFNGLQYAAGPSGLFQITGTKDNGVNIEWTVRTGQHDDKNANLKRLNELLMAVRFNGPIRVRVYTDDSAFFDYTLANFRENTLHQVRIPVGKGMRSRYYRIDISGLNGSTCQIDSLQIPMEPVARRAG